MQLLLHSDDLSDTNSKMSVVEVSEAVSEKLKTNEMIRIPDGDCELSSDAPSEVLSNDTGKDANCVNSDLGTLEPSSNDSVMNICNGKIDVDLSEKVNIVTEDNLQNNCSSKDRGKLNNDKENDDEMETVDTSEAINNLNETNFRKEVSDSDSQTSNSSESLSPKNVSNLFNGTEIPVTDDKVDKNQDRDTFSTHHKTILITQKEEKNASSEQTVEIKTENDLIENESDKTESSTDDAVKNMETVQETTEDLNNPIVTENVVTEIKTEHETQSDQQDVEMTAAEKIFTDTFENIKDIKKEARSFDTEGESSTEHNSSVSNDVEKSLEISNSIAQSISLKTENEAVEEDTRIQIKKKSSSSEIDEVEKQCNEKDSSDKISAEQIVDGQIEHKAVEIRNEKSSSSFESNKTNNESSTITSAITETNDNVVLSGDNNVGKLDTNSIEEHEALNDANTNSEESSNLSSSTNIDISNIARLRDDVHEIVERNEEKCLSKEKELPHKTDLAQTLDILSDSDDESHKSTPVNASEKQCINLVDDDDVMLVDDDSTGRDQLVKDVGINDTASEKKVKDVQEQKSEEVENDQKIVDDCTDDVMATTDKLMSPTMQEDLKIEEKPDEIKLSSEPEKPLVPIDFMKYCKPILSEMTRDHLEDFCLQRIVESIVDRSNFSEVKTKLKVMAQNCEEWRKKAMMLSKQNRDLQIVLKTVQEEQKKKPAEVIAPLRITRSVGMQVYMVEPNRNDGSTARGRRPGPANRWRGPTPVTAAGVGVNACAGLGVGRGASGTGARGLPTPAIPVPRLVPAPTPNVNSPTKTARTPPPSPSPQQLQLQSTAVSSNTSRTVSTSASPAAGGGTSPAQAQPHARSAEKRPLNGGTASGGGVSGGQSVTVDLTDDEPPAKQPARAVGSLRVVPQQQLVAQPRATAPRKVYIPISGTQTQTIRPGQTIMFKNVVPPSQRARNPGGLWMGGSGTGNMVRLAPRTGPRHPAPLPEAPKQAQPPNWKTLPPAPDLKISKVENGIVISWKIDGYQEDTWEEIASYQLYAYQETSSAPSTMLWKKIGDVKALPLPMACTLTQFMAGYKYYFAVRAVDIRSRIGPFSLPGSILLLNK